MQATIKNNQLVITIDLAADPKLTSTGKSLLIANSGGWVQTAAEVNGQNVAVNLTAIVKNTSYVKGQAPANVVPVNTKSNGKPAVNNRLRPVVA